ncbi:MAG TPA: ABC transporter substrate-binding protein [Candidatus Limnocylindria bacterium]|nr:ABC transporter substrate-binding protein [Candidatus Limnocylindria bacterium]
MSYHFSRSKLLALVTSAGLLAAACGGGGSTPSAAPSSAASTQATASAAAAGQLPKPELTKIRIGLSAPSEPVQFAEKLADMMGIYQKNGITDVTIIGFEGDGKALQAVVSGQLDMFVGGASTAINSVITDTPLKVVSMNSVILNDELVCQKEIKTPADVKGKTLAISTFGGTSHGSALLMLKGIGLTAKDVVLKEVGGEGTRVAALKGGSIACAVVGFDNVPALTSTGFNALYDLSKSPLQWGRSGLMARTDFLQKNPNTVLVVVASVLEAQNLMWTDAKNASAKFAEFSQKKPDDAANLVTGFQAYGSRSMSFSQDAFAAPRDVLATVNPAVKDVDVTKAYDLSFLKKLQDIGFYKKIGAPTN